MRRYGLFRHKVPLCPSRELQLARRCRIRLMLSTPEHRADVKPAAQERAVRYD